MEANELKALLGKYYSGDILPDEYQTLLKALKEDSALTSKLESERTMLIAIDSCEPSMPDGFGDRLVAEIDRRARGRRNFLKMAFSGAAAAIAAIFTVAGYLHQDKGADNEELSIAAQTVDDALLEVLVSIDFAKNEAVDAIDNIEIVQITDYKDL